MSDDFLSELCYCPMQAVVPPHTLHTKRAMTTQERQVLGTESLTNCFWLITCHCVP